MVLGSALAFLAALFAVNSIPTWNLETRRMTRLEGLWVNVYCETEEDAARDVFALADERTEQIARALGFTEKQEVNVYIYDAQSTMQTKKYGLIGPLLGLDWYIGDNIGADVILTSPANPGPVHSYDNNKNAVLHEIVHAYISVENPDIALWLTEGTALYLTNGEPFHREVLKYLELPSCADTTSRNPVRFSTCGGYTFAHTYIEYLDATYGWDAVRALLAGGSYEETLHATQPEVYAAWVEFVRAYPQ